MDRCSFARMVRERVLRLDGATGTELAKQGMPPGVCPEKWVTENPQALCAVQSAYVNAGSNIVYACTFGANPFKLAEFGLEKNCCEMNARLVGISRQAVAGKALVFGDIAPTGQLVEPFGELSFEECVSAYKVQVQGLLEGGADGFAIETMMDLQECRAALIAVRELAPDHPVIVTMTFDESGRKRNIAALDSLFGIESKNTSQRKIRSTTFNTNVISDTVTYHIRLFKIYFQLFCLVLSLIFLYFYYNQYQNFHQN